MNEEMNTPGYGRLAYVLTAAYAQAAAGKGKERHASNGVPFHEQPMSAINRQLGSIDGFIYQAHKKSLEAKRLPNERAKAELLGAINYLAGAWIALDTWAAKPEIEQTPDPLPVLPKAQVWVTHDGGIPPVTADTLVIYRSRGGVVFNKPTRADHLDWSHARNNGAGDVVSFAVVQAPDGL